MLNLNQTLTLTKEKYVHDASNVLTGIFVENGHRNHMLAITNEIGNHKNEKLTMQLMSRILSSYRGYQSLDQK